MEHDLKLEQPQATILQNALKKEEKLKGIYVLIIQIKNGVNCGIGALGELNFQQGLYAYVGSAQNNLELRVKRHQRKEKHLFWHIDYLLSNEASKVIAVYYSAGKKAEECIVSNMIETSGALPIRGFGCSDCRCKSHLFRIENFHFLDKCLYPFKLS